jgi:tetratricopeptide (TPR) repeat protein
MARRSIRAMIAVAAAAISAAPTARAQDAAEEQFGKVHFSTSCNDQAQRRFDRAMRYQHSFWYRPAREIFEEALKADPECAIAYWGIALTLLLNPHIPPPKDNLALGLSSLEKARSIGAKTQRERDYVDALRTFYADHDKVPHGPRVQAYLKAMEGLAGRYPDDDEAQIGYAHAERCRVTERQDLC